MNDLKDEQYVLQVLIALAYVDDSLSNKEKAWILKFIESKSFSDEQKIELAKFLTSPKLSYLESFKNIKAHSSRTKCLDLARHLFQVDDELCGEEKNAFNLLKGLHTEISGDLRQINYQVAEELLKTAHDNAFYNDLESFGKLVRERRTRPYSGLSKYDTPQFFSIKLKKRWWISALKILWMVALGVGVIWKIRSWGAF